MKIALFRYHDHLDVCKNHLELFRKFNPDIPVYGVYGGKPEDFEKYTKELNILSGNYCLTELDQESKWKSFDYALKEWYRNAGRKINFEQLYLIEWDFILLESIDKVYKRIPVGSAGFSGLIKLKKIEKKWYWTGNAQRREEWIKLMNFVKEYYKYNSDPYGVLCPGFTVPRKYLEGLLDIQLPNLGNDELRFPIYAQLLNINMEDTRFYRKWFSKREWRYFNCNNKEISEKRMFRQFRWRWGRRAFHPFRNMIDLERIKL